MSTQNNLHRILTFDPRLIHPRVRVSVLKTAIMLMYPMEPLVNGTSTLNADLEYLLKTVDSNPLCRFVFFMQPTRGFSVTTLVHDSRVDDDEDIMLVERYTTKGTYPYKVERFTDPFKWYKAGLELCSKKV